MQDHRVGSRPNHALGIDLIRVAVFLQARQIPRAHPLELQAQRHHRVRSFNSLADVGRDRHAVRLEFSGQECGRAAQAHPRPEFRQQLRVAARHAAVAHVADNGDFQPLERLKFLLQGVRVQQRLRRVGAATIARVDDLGVRPFGHLMRRAGRAVPDDEGVDLHRLERLNRVLQTLALGGAAVG